MASNADPILLGRPEDELMRLRREVLDLKAENRAIIEHLNRWVAKVQAIDAIAYVSLMLHGEVEIKLTEENVKRNAATVKAAIKEMERFQAEAVKKQRKQNAKGTKSKK